MTYMHNLLIKYVLEGTFRVFRYYDERVGEVINDVKTFKFYYEPWC